MQFLEQFFVFTGSPFITHNVPTLGAVGDFGKLNCLPARMYNRSRNFHLTMSAPIAPNVCYAFVLSFSMLFLRSISRCFTFVCKLFFINFVNRLNGKLSENEYKKITSVLLSGNSLNVQEPRNDLNI